MANTAETKSKSVAYKIGAGLFILFIGFVTLAAIRWAGANALPTICKECSPVERLSPLYESGLMILAGIGGGFIIREVYHDYVGHVLPRKIEQSIAMTYWLLILMVLGILLAAYIKRVFF